ncbi:MAG: hypothetical protein ACRDTA_13990 [Pseudonocardiaceae bacterium]
MPSVYRTTDAGAFAEAHHANSAGFGAVDVGWHVDAGATGGKELGETSPTGQQWSIVSLELIPVGGVEVEEVAGGSHTATIGTEHTLATVTDPGMYVQRVDLANMVAGDVVELRVYATARTTDTERLMYGPDRVRADPPRPETQRLDPRLGSRSLQGDAETDRGDWPRVPVGDPVHQRLTNTVGVKWSPGPAHRRYRTLSQRQQPVP